MATRVYFPEATAAPVAVTPPGGWTHDQGVRRRLAVRSPGTSALVTTDFVADSSDDLNPSAALLRQYVSDPLAAQTISGTIFGQLQCLEDHANNNLGLAVRIYTVNTAGTTVTHTLLGLTQDIAEVGGTSGTGGTTLRNQGFGFITLTAATVAAGERLVLEIGLGGTPGPAAGQVQGHNGQIRWGETASSGDLPVDNTTTATTFRGWFEFSANLAFFVTPAPVLEAVGLGETQTKTLGKAPTTEALALAETQKKALSRAPVAEALGLTEFLNAAVFIVAPPSVTPGVTHWALRHFADAHWAARQWVIGGTQRLIQEAVALLESVTRRVTKAPTDALPVTETLRKALQRQGPAEALALTEQLVSVVMPTTRPTHWAPTHWALKMWAPRHWPKPSGTLNLRTVTESLGLTEALVPQKRFPLPPAESVAVSELHTGTPTLTGARIFNTILELLPLREALVPQKRFPLPPAEGLAVGEGIATSQVPRTLTESLGLSETLTSPLLVGPTTYAHWANAHWTATHWLEVIGPSIPAQSLTDPLGLGETITKRIGRLLGEPLPLTEGVTRQVARPVTEALPVAEALIRRVARALTESLPLVEVLHASFALRVADALPLSEGLARTGFAQITLGDTLPLSESLRKLVRTATSDALPLVDSLGKALALALPGEALPVAEQLFSVRTGLARSTQDALPLAEGLTRILARHLVLADALALEEALLRDGQPLIVIRHYILPAVHLDGSTRAPRIVVDYVPERLIVQDEEGILV